jgi:hypothetical protein
MKAPTPGIRVRDGDARVILGAGLDLPLHRRELAVEIGDQGEQALEAAAGGLGQRELAEEGTSPRPEELSAPVLDTLTRKQRVDAILQRGPHAREPDVMADKLPQLAQLARSDVGLREQIRAQQMRERARVDGVGLHPRGGDRLGLPRMSKMELDPLRLEQVRQPLPAKGRLECDLGVISQLSKDRTKRLRVVRHPSREQLETLIIEGSNVRGPAVKVDADVHHGGLLSDPELTASA